MNAEQIKSAVAATPTKEGGLAAMVCCKSELYFQTATGDTMTTWYPCGPVAGQFIADKLGVPFSEE